MRSMRSSAFIRLCAWRLGGLGGKGHEETLPGLELGQRLVVHRLLHRELRRALLLERGVVARVQRELSAADMHNVRDAGSEEIPVVRDQHQGAAVAGQPLLQPHHRIEVEVVGRFVEQQQVRARDERLREVEAHPPAAGEARYRPLGVGTGEAQPGEQRCRAGARRVAAISCMRACSSPRWWPWCRPRLRPDRSRERATRGRRRARIRSPPFPARAFLSHRRNRPARGQLALAGDRHAARRATAQTGSTCCRWRRSDPRASRMDQGSRHRTGVSLRVRALELRNWIIWAPFAGAHCTAREFPGDMPAP